MLAACRRRKATNRATQPGLSSELWQWQLAEFSTQRRAHNRQFVQLVDSDEFLAGTRARQEAFSIFLSSVRIAFDQAQEKRQEHWRATGASADMPDVTYLCSAQSEGPRDAAARDGLVHCSERAAESRRMLYRAYLDVWMELGETFRSTIERWSTIALTADQVPYSPPYQTESQSSLVPVVQRPMPGSCACDCASSSLPPETTVTASNNLELDRIATDISADDGGVDAFNTAFAQLQAERLAIWRRVSAGRSEIIEAWHDAFRNLSAELATAFRTDHPQFMDGPSASNDDAGLATVTALMVAAFRAAEVRRNLELERLWKSHIGELRRAIDLHMELSMCGWSLEETFVRRVWITNMPLGRSLSTRKLSESTGPGEESRHIGGAPGCTQRSECYLNKLCPSDLGELEHHQRQAFREAQRRRKDQFTTFQFEMQLQAHTGEIANQAAFSSAISQWETEAARAERARNTEFAQALDRVRAQRRDTVARRCEEVAMLLDRAFEDAQRHREEAFRNALENLSRELLSLASLKERNFHTQGVEGHRDNMGDNE